MLFFDATVMIEGKFGCCSAEYCEGVPNATEGIDKPVIHLIRQVQSRLANMVTEDPKNVGIYIEITEMRGMSRSREAWLKWRLVNPKRPHLEWKLEKRTTLQTGGESNGQQA